jgi:hypothetical protein
MKEEAKMPKAPDRNELLGYLHEAGTPTSTFGRHPDREKLMLWEYAKGKTQAQLAREYELTPERVRQILFRWYRILLGQVGRVRRGEQQRQKTTAD